MFISRLILLAAFLLSVSPPASSQPLEISGRHLLQIDTQTEILIEGQTVDPLDALLAPGMKLLAIEGGSTRGVAPPLTLLFDFDLRGIITGTDPGRVFGTPLAISAETTLLGLTAAFDPQTRDDDGIVVAGLANDTQVQVRGWIDRDGGLHASAVPESNLLRDNRETVARESKSD